MTQACEMCGGERGRGDAGIYWAAGPCAVCLERHSLCGWCVVRLRLSGTRRGGAFTVCPDAARVARAAMGGG